MVVFYAKEKKLVDKMIIYAFQRRIKGPRMSLNQV